METKHLFEVYKGGDSLYYWRLKSTNGEIVCSGEGYSTKQAAQEAIERFRKYAADAEILMPEF